MRPSIESARIADVLGGDAGRKVAVDRHRHRAGAHLRQGLRREHVLDLAGTDAERERGERAVGRRMAVAAHDRHAGLREALLGTDHVHDPLPRVTHRVAADSELPAVACEHVHLLRRDRVLEWLVETRGGHVVVHRRDRQVRSTDAAPRQPEPVERLGRGDLVHEVEIDEQEIGFAGGRAHDVLVPHLLRQGAAHGAPSFLARRLVE
jgi:hypothetical protein